MKLRKIACQVSDNFKYEQVIKARIKPRSTDYQSDGLSTKLLFDPSGEQGL